MSSNGTNGIQVPYSQEAEEAVLGAVLVDPDQYKVLASRLVEDDFFFLKHGYIWRAISDLDKAGQPLDYLTLCVKLEQMGLMQTVGGPPFITEIAYKTPTSQHAQVYADLVRRACVRRQMLSAADSWKALALDETLTLEEINNKTQELFLNVRGRVIETRESHIRDTCDVYLEDFQKRVDAGMNVEGVPSGLIDLDDLLGGFEKQRLYVLAGRPGMGKSSLLVGIALHVAKAGLPVYLFLHEMSKADTLKRMIAMETGVSTRQQRQVTCLTPANLSQITACLGNLSRLPIMMDDLPRTTAEMESFCIVQKRTTGLALVLSDGLYCQPSGIPSASSYEQLSRLAHDNKTLAKTLDVPVITTHQLSRDVDDRKDHRPVLADLRGSGQIEEVADSVIFLYRDSVYNEATECPNQCDLIVAKNRDGGTGTIPAYFEKTLTKFMNATQRRVDLGNEKVIPLPKPAALPAGKTQAAMSAPEG
jgi:replicative DNA helicase